MNHCFYLLISILASNCLCFLNYKIVILFSLKTGAQAKVLEDVLPLFKAIIQLMMKNEDATLSSYIASYLRKMTSSEKSKGDRLDYNLISLLWQGAIYHKGMVYGFLILEVD